MAHTLGKQLAQSRAKQNLSVEDVAHRTRIPGSIVKYLENDDYSHFPNLVYAKSFLKMYSRFLDVDASEFLEELREASTDRRESPFLQAQMTREELTELSKNRLNLDFIPWSKIFSILFFIGVSIPAAMFIAKLYKENKPKIEERLSGDPKSDDDDEGTPEPELTAEPDIKPAIPEGIPNGDTPVAFPGDTTDVPKAVPVARPATTESPGEEGTGEEASTTGTEADPGATGTGEEPGAATTTTTATEESPEATGANRNGTPVASTPPAEDN